MSREAGVNTQIYEEASQWLVTFRTGEPDATAKRDLDEWLRRSPEHVKAYLEVSSIWEHIPFHDSVRRVDAQAHIERARRDGNVVALKEAARAGTSLFSLRRSLAMAAAVLLCLGLAMSVWLYQTRPTHYSTRIGEQRSFALPDGSLVNLDVHTSLRVHFSDRERRIELLDGQALFQVAHDARRPFIVDAGGAGFRAVGTQFDVYKRSTGVTVTVLEGRVATESSNAPVVLSAGQQLTVSAAKAAPPKRADLTAATAWTQRRLVFDSVPLSQVAEEFNRYNSRPLVVADPDMEDFEVVGVFSSADPRPLLKFLAAQPDLQVVEREDKILILRK
jgi:transmembrane sensor